MEFHASGSTFQSDDLHSFTPSPILAAAVVSDSHQTIERPVISSRDHSYNVDTTSVYPSQQLEMASQSDTVEIHASRVRRAINPVSTQTTPKAKRRRLQEAKTMSVQTTPKKFASQSSQATTPRRSILQVRIRELSRRNAELRDNLDVARENLSSQEMFLKRILNIDNLQSNEVLLKYYTGIASYRTFEVLCKHVQKLAVNVRIRLLSLQECILMVLVKVRRNLGLQMLAHLFGVSKGTVTRIMHSITPCLSKVLSNLVVNPSALSVRRHLPPSFKISRQFRRTRFIVDCTEVFIQQPTSLLARAQTYSNYKGHNTIKLFIACTPTGGVAFVSKAWGGRISDIELIRRSGFYDIIEPGDNVLADRGFRIAEDLAAKQGTLSVPSFTRGKKQLPGRCVERSAEISRIRIHVERTIGQGA